MTKTFERKNRKSKICWLIVVLLVVVVVTIILYFPIDAKQTLQTLARLKNVGNFCITYAGLILVLVLNEPPDFKYEIELKEEEVEIRFKRDVKKFNKENLEIHMVNENYITITDGVENVRVPYNTDVLFFLGFLQHKLK